jgi:hypothetical protein
MSKEHIIAQLQGRTNHPYRSIHIDEMEEALEGTYWKHDSDRHQFKGMNVEPTRYYKFGELLYSGGQPAQAKVVFMESWSIELIKHPYKTVRIPVMHLGLLTHITDPDELGMVALMYL